MPWKALHPKGAVKTIRDAVDPKYDQFYRSQNKVTFKECAFGYLIDNERPIKFNVFGSSTRRTISDERDVIG